MMLLFKICKMYVCFIGRGNIEKGSFYIIRNVFFWEVEEVNMIVNLLIVYCIELIYKLIFLLVV